jgi:hypothetical protein
LILAEPAYHGLVGQFVRAVSNYTEATDAGVMAHLLSAGGTYIGPGPYHFAGGKQYARINAGLVGPTSTGRKGTSEVPVNGLMEWVDKKFWDEQHVSGLSSGEGLIAKVADIKIWNPETKEYDPGPPVDKRLNVTEPEFARVLANMGREGNILSHVIRDAFDSGNLATLTVNPRQASGAHICMTVHCTPEELEERLHSLELVNGFANRFCWFFVKSDKVMPHTEPIPETVYEPLGNRLREVANLKERNIDWTKAAAGRWEKEYERLREDRPGLEGKVLARGQAIVPRLALIYCLLDEEKRRRAMDVDHLEAALAVWAYCEGSAELLFESETDDKDADKLLKLLRARGPMTATEMNKHLSNAQKRRRDEALNTLMALSLVAKSTEDTGGRPAERYEAVPQGEEAGSA